MPKDAKLSKPDANPALSPPLMEHHMLKVKVKRAVFFMIKDFIVVTFLLAVIFAESKLVVVPGIPSVAVCIISTSASLLNQRGFPCGSYTCTICL